MPPTLPPALINSAADAKQKGEALLTGLNLTRAHQWLIERQAQDFNSEEREFIAASVARAQAATRRKRRLSTAAACILLAITGAAVWGAVEAVRGRNEAAAARSAALSSVASTGSSALRQFDGRAGDFSRIVRRISSSPERSSSAPSKGGLPVSNS